MEEETPSLSIVVPCHNAEETIEGTCDTLINIVNSWPKRTVDILKSFRLTMGQQIAQSIKCDQCIRKEMVLWWLTE